MATTEGIDTRLGGQFGYITAWESYVNETPCIIRPIRLDQSSDRKILPIIHNGVLYPLVEITTIPTPIIYPERKRRELHTILEDIKPTLQPYMYNAVGWARDCFIESFYQQPKDLETAFLKALKALGFNLNSYTTYPRQTGKGYYP